MAAQSTYTPISTYTVTSGPTNGIYFSSIPSTYTDLVFVIFGKESTANTSIYTLSIAANADTSSTYSYTYIRGDGSSATSSRSTLNTFFVGTTTGSSNTPFTVTQGSILNYSNSTTRKTCISRSASDMNGSGNTYESVSLWPQTTAINALSFYVYGGNGFINGSTITLYGITAA
jgi:hypothetical protein